MQAFSVKSTYFGFQYFCILKLMGSVGTLELNFANQMTTKIFLVQTCLSFNTFVRGYPKIPRIQYTEDY